GFRDAVFFADQREAGIARMLNEPIPAASRGTVAHCKGQPISLKCVEEARLRSALLLWGRRRALTSTPPARKHEQSARDEQIASIDLHIRYLPHFRIICC